MTTASINLLSKTSTSITLRTEFTGTNGDEADSVSVGRYPTSSSNTSDDTVTESFSITSDDTSYLEFTGLNPDTTYYFEGSYLLDGGLDAVYSMSRKSYTTDSANTRPSDFSWDYAKYSGNQFYLTATEWNRFTDRINEFRVYKGLSEASFTIAYSGNGFTASMFNETLSGIDAMSPSTSTPSLVSSGDKVYASDLNRLRDSLNSID